MRHAKTDDARLFYLDNLRVFLTGLVICHHLSIAFGAPGLWYYKVTDSPDIVTMSVLSMFVAINQAYFMSLFFLVSSYFTAPSCDRKGTRAFLRDRFLRLGIPLVVYYFLLNPCAEYLVLRFQGKTDEALLPFLSGNLFQHIGCGPLWFVQSLLLFATVYVIARRFARPADETDKPRPLPDNMQILAFILLGAATFTVRLKFPDGTGLLGFPAGNSVMYISIYAVGIFAYRWSWLDQLTTEQANRWFHLSLVMIAIFPVFTILGGAMDGKVDVFGGGLHWQAYAYAAWQPFICVGISMKLLVLFRTHLNDTSRLKGMLSKSAYTAYIIHPFFVIVASRLFRDVPLPLIIRFLVLAPVVVASCFLVSNIIRQLPLLKRIL